MFSGRGSTRSLISGCGRPKVGVVAKFLRALRARYIYFLLCPGLSFHKLGNYVKGVLLNKRQSEQSIDSVALLLSTLCRT